MPKILGSWSAMREYLEKEMLAESLAGRVRYGCTSYVGMDGAKIFEICIDGKQIKRFSPETVNYYFIEKGYKEKTRLAMEYGRNEKIENCYRLSFIRDSGRGYLLMEIFP